MKAQKVLLTSSLLVLAGFTLISCGARNTGSADFSSQATTTVDGKLASYCSEYNDGDIRFKFSAVTGVTGKIDPSKIRMKVLSIPSTYWQRPSNSNSFHGYDIIIRKGLVTGSTVTYSQSGTSVGYPDVYVEDASAGGGYSVANSAILNAAGGNTMEWPLIAKLLSLDPASSTVTAKFFNEHTFLIDLKDPNGVYKAMKIEYRQYTYDASGKITDFGNANRSREVLIPAFEASPVEYSAGHPAILTALHPYYSWINSGLSSTEFQTMSQDMCF